jgi:phage terminase large subunit
MIVKLPHDVDFRHYQKDLFEACLIEGKKRLVQVLHRRAGKDFAAINLTVALLMRRVGTGLYLFPELTQARKAIWNGITEDGRRFLDLFPSALIKSVHNSDMRITLINGSIFQLGGADRYDNLRGTNPIVLCYSEYAQGDPGAWLYLSPIVRKNGGVAIFCYTPFGLNHGYDLYETNKDNPEWFCQYLPITKTHHNDGSPIISEEDVQKDMRAGIPRSVINQEYYLDWHAPLVGAFYVDEINLMVQENRVRDIAINPNLSVITAWDIGLDDYTAIWFAQVINKEIRIVNFYQNHNQDLGFYIDYINKFAAEHRIDYSHHFAPHDINQRELTNNTARIITAQKLGIRFIPLSKSGIMDGIEIVKLLFPRFWFDEKNCQEGLNALRCYRREYNPRLALFKAPPVHDFASHPADALRYLCIGYETYFCNMNRTGRVLTPPKQRLFK